MIRLKWKCDHCKYKNEWEWPEYEMPEGVSEWFCDRCNQSCYFAMHEKRPGEWRRKKPCKHEAIPGIAYTSNPPQYKCAKCGELFRWPS